MKNRQTKPFGRALLFWIFLIIVIVFPLWWSRNAIANWLTPVSERYRQEGDSYLAENRLAEAVLAYYQAVDADSSNQAAILSLADAYQKQGRFRTAQRYYDRVTQKVTVDPVVNQPAQVPVWINATVDSLPTGAALQGQVLYVAYENSVVLAVNANTGSILWQVKLSDPITSAVAASQQRVLVGMQTGVLQALSPIDGRALWTFKTGAPLYAAAAMMVDRVYCPSSDGWLYALNAQDGTMIWKFQTAGAVNSTPALAEHFLYFGSSDGKLYALDADSGAPVWQDGILTSGAVESQPAVHDQRVFFGSGDGRVYALDTATGGQYWRYSTADAVYAPVILEGERLLVASSGHTLSAVDIITGKRAWKTDLGGPLRTPPAVHGTTIYQLVESDPNLYLLERETGKIVETIHTGDWNAAGPWIAGDRVILLGKDGAILAYPLAP